MGGCAAPVMERVIGMADDSPTCSGDAQVTC